MAAPYKIIDFIGKQFSRLTIIGSVGIVNGRTHVMAFCECGDVRDYSLKNIIRNNSKSCGCWNIENITKHGFSKRGKGHIRMAWNSMIDRCYNQKAINFDNYGGRGVEVCDEWKNDFMIFYSWAINNGWKKGLHLDKDKLSPNKAGMIYCPEYCSFITAKENGRYRINSRVLEYNGLSMCASAWAEYLKIRYGTLCERLRHGWSIDRIANTPVQSYLSNKKVA